MEPDDYNKPLEDEIMDDWLEDIQVRLSGLPEASGVYLFRDSMSQIIYVGKAKVLKNRVKSYFQKREGKDAKTDLLVTEIRTFEYIVTKTELEALVLENTLIKQHKPRYNILLKDDKSFPFLKITTQETYPRLEIVRKISNDGAKYIAAFTSAANLRASMDPVRKIFPIRTCKREITSKRRQRACLYYHIGLCSGPCAHLIEEEQYRLMVKDLCRFLEGKHEEVMSKLQTRMSELSDNLEFEKAALLRDRIEHLRRLSRKQAVVSDKLDDRDIIGLAGDGYNHAVNILSVRKGKLVAGRCFVLEGIATYSDEEVIEAVLMQHYREPEQIPREFLLEAKPFATEPVIEWLSQKRGAKVVIQVPKRGFKTELIDMAKRNAAEELAQFSLIVLSRRKSSKIALDLLNELLKSKTYPSVIEAYDVSNTGVSEMVAAMVVFKDGGPERSLYRRFKIKNQVEQNDYASMQQAVYRRFRRYLDESRDISFAQIPDLILTDGGIGHVHAVQEVLTELGLQIPVWGMAKDEKHRSHRLVSDIGELALSRYPEVLRFVSSIQNEVHRFAIAYNKKLRSNRQVASAFDGLPGIGPVKKKALLKAFGSYAAVKRATVDEIAVVEGFSVLSAQKLKDRMEAGL